ncbi:MAG: nitroreductase family protein [Thermoplasmatota archaeon]
MELTQAIEGRRSIRVFKKGELPEGALEEAVRLGNSAPSAGNLQARDFVLVRERATRERLAEAALGQGFVAEAPAVIVVCANARRIAPYGERGRELYMLQDAAAAIQNILLYLHSRGLGCCWVGAFDESAVSEVLGLPGDVRPVALLPVGAPGERPAKRRRLALSEILHYERW